MFFFILVDIVLCFIVTYVIYYFAMPINTKLKIIDFFKNIKHMKENLLSSVSISSIMPYERTFNPIPDQFKTLTQVQNAIKNAGLESCNLIIGIDYTASNEWTGKNTFGGRSLHTISSDIRIKNPYESALHIICKTLSTFDEDNLIPVYGFGDQKTKDKQVFSFLDNEKPIEGLENVAKKYREITPTLILSGPTSFAPLIRKAIDIIKNDWSYHILLIIADGQVTDPEETGKLIVEASNYPLSIIMIGVGDGPWGIMDDFDDELPERKFDNFQFVDFNVILKKYDGESHKFALHALMEIPDQYKYIKKLGLLNNTNNNHNKNRGLCWTD